MICIAPIMATKSQYRDEEVGMFVTNLQQESVFSVWHGRLTANWRYEIYSATPDVRSRHTERSLGCLSACPRLKETRSIGGPQRPRRQLVL